MSAQKKGRVLFRIVKGFIYGNVLGLFFGIAIYLLGSAVNTITPLPVTPPVLAGVRYGASVMAGVGKEYSDWLDEQ
jgi:hypothetical protein